MIYFQESSKLRNYKEGKNQNKTPSKDTQRSLWYSKFNVAKHKTRVLNIHDGETESGKGSRCVIPNVSLLSRARNLIDIELFFFVHDLERVTVVRLPIRRRTGFPEGPSHLPRGFYISVTLFRRGQSREKLRYQYAASSPCIYSWRWLSSRRKQGTVASLVRVSGHPSLPRKGRAAFRRVNAVLWQLLTRFYM